MVKVEAYDATKRRKKSRGVASLVELPSDDPLSVDGTDLDPRPSRTSKMEMITRLKEE